MVSDSSSGGRQFLFHFPSYYVASHSASFECRQRNEASLDYSVQGILCCQEVSPTHDDREILR